MKLIKIRAGYYDFEQFSLIQDESGWWSVYQWNANHDETDYVCSANTLRFAKEQLTKFIKQKVKA